MHPKSKGLIFTWAKDAMFKSEKYKDLGFLPRRNISYQYINMSFSQHYKHKNKIIVHFLGISRNFIRTATLLNLYLFDT